MRCYTATRIYLPAELPLKPSIPKSPPFPLSSSLKGSLMLPVLALHNCVYKALIFCSSASITAVLLANDTNVACWASREDDIANETLFSQSTKTRRYAYKSRTLRCVLRLGGGRCEFSLNLLKGIRCEQDGNKRRFNQYLNRRFVPLHTVSHLYRYSFIEPDGPRQYRYCMSRSGRTLTGK